MTAKRNVPLPTRGFRIKECGEVAHTRVEVMGGMIWIHQDPKDVIVMNPTEAKRMIVAIQKAIAYQKGE